MTAYRSNARRRGLSFSLSADEFRSLVTSSCEYCGSEPSAVSKHSGAVTEKTRHNSEFTYNGIDRKNNSVGYHYVNCVSCCGTCNKAKLAMSYSEFIEWIQRVHSHLKLD
jgi:hypothetical protein